MKQKSFVMNLIVRTLAPALLNDKVITERKNNFEIQKL